MAEDISFPSPSVLLQPSPKSSAPPLVLKRRFRRPNGWAKKKAPRPAATTTTDSTDGGGVKPKQTKSRNGCAVCKVKRLKCDEKTPGCEQCARRKVPCPGYKKDFKWKPFEESNVKAQIDYALELERQKQAGNLPKRISTESSKPTTPEIVRSPSKTPDAASSPLETPNGERCMSEESRAQSDSVLDVSASANAEDQPLSSSEDSELQLGVLSIDSVSLTSIEDMSEQNDASHSTTDLQTSREASMPIPLVDPAYYDVEPLVDDFMPTLGVSAPLVDLYLPFDVSKPDHVGFWHQGDINNLQDQSFDDIMDPEDFGNETSMYELDQTVTEGDMMLRTSFPPQSPDFFHRQPDQVLYPVLSPDDVNRAILLTQYFANGTCNILSMLTHPDENPWRTVVWRLAQRSPTLYHAVTAMTAFHAAIDMPELLEIGVQHQLAAVQWFSQGIAENSIGDLTAIAACLALSFAERFDRQITTGISHIKTAFEYVKRALANHRLEPFQGEYLEQLRFLCNATIYMDVIARLTSAKSKESVDWEEALFLNAHRIPKIINGQVVGQGFGINFGISPNARLDPLMGCANTLFPLIGKVANLVRCVCRSNETETPILAISDARELRNALLAWQPPPEESIMAPAGSRTTVGHMLLVAETYRYATLLHLRAAAPELEGLHSGSLARQVLKRLANLDVVDDAILVTIYPLMIAGCEQKPDEAREFVLGRWLAMKERMRIGSIDKCLQVTEEVWARRDFYAMQSGSGRDLFATAQLPPSFQQEQPLVTTPGGSIDWRNPIRTGLVFSYYDEGDDPDANAPSSSSQDERVSRRSRCLGNIKPITTSLDNMDPAFTVRGHAHWIGVMANWGWEVFLG